MAHHITSANCLFHEFVIPNEVRDLQFAAKIQAPHFVRDDKIIESGSWKRNIPHHHGC
jgi:hypothetical protein